MPKTGIYANKKHTEKLFKLGKKVLISGKSIMNFSVGYGAKKDNVTKRAFKACQELAQIYGLPEIEGFYSITGKGEFVSVKQYRRE